MTILEWFLVGFTALLSGVSIYDWFKFRNLNPIALLPLFICATYGVATYSKWFLVGSVAGIFVCMAVVFGVSNKAKNDDEK